MFCSGRSELSIKSSEMGGNAYAEDDTVRNGRLAAGKTESADAGHRVTGKAQSQHSEKGKPPERTGRKAMGLRSRREAGLCLPDRRNFTIQIKILR